MGHGRNPVPGRDAISVIDCPSQIMFSSSVSNGATIASAL